MRYRIAIHQSDEGYSVSVPGLPGCWSQGATDAEAVDVYDPTTGAIRSQHHQRDRLLVHRQ